MTDITHTLTVDRPVREVYDQWTRFESFPDFMGGVESVRQVDDTHTAWVVEIAGVKREFDATITEQIPDQRISWTTTDGSVHGGTVSFRSAAPEQTEVVLAMDFEPEGFVEKAGAALGVVKGRVKTDLEKFKELMENGDAEGGGWRGQVNGGQSVGGSSPGRAVPGAESPQTPRPATGLGPDGDT